MLVGLEGPVCSGKSTFAARISAAFPDVVVFDDYVNGLHGSQIPNFDPGGTEQQLDAFNLFMQVEAERISVYNSDPERTYILDRSIDTLFAHAYALDKLKGYNSYGLAQSTTAPDRYLTPQVTLLLDPPREVLLQRAKQRGDEEVLAPFLSKEFLSATGSYFETSPVTPTLIQLTADQYTDALPAVALKVLRNGSDS